MATKSGHHSPLKVVVIGGGLAGLATAFAIARTKNPNLSVIVLERQSTLSEVGAGIGLGPNAARMLDKFGLRAQLEAIATFPVSMEFRRYDTGKVIGNIWQNYQGFMEKMYGYPFSQVHRADLQQLLAKAAHNAGVEIKLNQRVERLKYGSGSPEIILQDGAVVKADLVIGADGVGSKIRSSILENKDVKPADGHEYTYRFLIPRDKILSCLETSPLIQDQHNFLVYAGPKQAVIGYPITKALSLYNVVLPVQRRSDARLAAYTEPGDIDEMRQQYDGFDNVVRTLIGLADSPAKWSLAVTPSLPAWSSSNGSVILVGDAAHAMLPWAGSGGSTSIEDAAVLGELFSSYRSPSDIQRIARGFESLRRGRCERIQEMSWQFRGRFTMEDGPEQRARDESFGKISQMQKKKIEDGTAWQQKPEKDMNAPYPSPKALMWLYGYDGIEEARDYLHILN